MDRRDELRSMLAEALGPSGSAVLTDLIYAALLRRTAEDEVMEATVRVLDEGRMTPDALIFSIIGSEEYREAALLEEVLRHHLDEPFTLDGVPHWPGTSERLIEILWVLSRVPRGRVLDVGYAFASPVYLSTLVRSQPCYGLDVATRQVDGLTPVAGDARWMPFRDGSFDVVILISTVEHIGRDNSQYRIGAPTGPGGDVDALGEAKRVLAPAGSIFVTVPFGQREELGSQVQYDEAGWREVVAAAGLSVTEEQAFRREELGWVRSSIDSLGDVRYLVEANCAGAVLCAQLSA